jgi:hypothetical protein
LPLLGFTRQNPGQNPDMCRTLAKHMGGSITVGACGEAFARDASQTSSPVFVGHRRGPWRPGASSQTSQRTCSAPPCS